MKGMQSLESTGCYKAGRAAGFISGSALFASMLYIVLYLHSNVPSGAGYWHFLGAGIILSSIVLLLRGRRGRGVEI